MTAGHDTFDSLQEPRVSSMRDEALRALIADEREQGRAFGQLAEAARLELERRSDEPMRRAC